MSQYQWETGYEFGPAQETEFGEVGETYQGESYQGESYQGESPLHEAEEMEYASRLLEVNSEEELEDFLGDLVKSAARAVGGIVRSPVGKALTGS